MSLTGLRKTHYYGSNVGTKLVEASWKDILGYGEIKYMKALGVSEMICTSVNTLSLGRGLGEISGE
jgi:hypothetical protein